MSDWQPCPACGLGSLACMNRERLDATRCCRNCTGHGIDVSDAGHRFLVAAGYPDGDGITLLQVLVQAERGR